MSGTTARNTGGVNPLFSHAVKCPGYESCHFTLVMPAGDSLLHNGDQFHGHLFEEQTQIGPPK